MNLTEIVRRARQDPAWFFENYLWIENKETGQFQRLRLNNVQRDWFWPAMVKQTREIGRVRQYWLKARRMGASTLAAAKIFTNTITCPSTLSYIISHELDSAKNIFAMYELMYAMLPPPLQPMIRRGNTRELYFANPSRVGHPGLRSRLAVMSVDDKREKRGGAARSANVRNLHGSEVAFWGKAAFETMKAIQQAVPDAPGTSIIYESTAKEAGGEFYAGYFRAKENPDTEWRAVFVPWFAFSEYQLPLEPGETLNLEPDEHRLQSLHQLTREQLKWRRHVLTNKCNGSTATFKQEYPATDEEAFIYHRGNKVFNTDLLIMHLEKARNRNPVERLHLSNGVLKSRGDGDLRVWTQPSFGRKYVVAVDPSEGLREGCLQAIEVIDTATLEQAAEWTGLVSIHELARNAVAIGQHYEHALLAIEANNHGLAVLNKVRDLGYGNLYHQEVLGEDRHPTRRAGFLTSGKTKPMIEQLFDALLVEGSLLLNSPELVTEAIEFTRDENGISGPPSGKFSDRIMAFMIGLHVAYNLYGGSRHEKEIRETLAAQNGINSREADRLAFEKKLGEIRTEKFRQRQKTLKPEHGIAPLLYR